MASGAEIRLGFPTVADKLESRELEYLAGRELPEIPGLQLRQESAGGYTYTTWATTTVTIITTAPLPVTVVTPFPNANQQAGNIPGNGPVTVFDTNNTQASPTRPWMVTASETERHLPSYLGLFVCVTTLLVLDYSHGY